MAETGILVVEDQAIVARDIQYTLEELGYSVLGSVVSGEEAVAQADALRPDLVLMDIQLKGEMDGVQAAEQIRSRFDIPVIYLTAYADDDTLERAQVTGPFGYVLKPFEERELHSTIEMALYRHRADKQIRESEERFRSLVENATDIVLVLDGSGATRYVSPAVERLLGFKPEEVIGRPVVDWIHPDDLPGARERLARVIQSRAPLPMIRYRVRHRDGSWRVIESISRNRLDDPAVAGIVVNLRDVTGQVQAEEALREREQFLAALNEITRAALETSDLFAMQQTLADRLGELFGADGCYLTLWDEATQTAVPAAAYGQWREDYSSVAPEPHEPTMTESVLRAGRPLAVEDVFDTPYLSRRIAELFPERSLLGLPLIAGEQKLGAALIAFNEPHSFTEKEIAHGEQVAGQIALSIAKALLLEEAGDRVAELEALRRTSLQLTSSLDLSTVLDAVTGNALTLVGATDCHIYLYDEASESFTLGSALWQDGRRQAAVKTPRSDGFTATVAQKGHSVVIDDVPDHPLYASPEAQKWNLKAIAGFPIRRADRVLGVITIAFTEPHTFSKDELRVLGLLADQAAIAIENAQLHAETQKRLQEQIALREAGTAITSALDLQTVLSRIAEQMIRAVDATSAYICDFDPDSRASRVLAEYVGPEACAAERVSDLGESYVENDPDFVSHMRAGEHDWSLVDDPDLPQYERDHMEQYGVKSILYIPLRISGRPIGFAELWESRRKREFTPEEIELCHDIAQQAAIAVENARLYGEAQTQLQLAQTLQQVGALLTAEMPLEKVFERLFDLLAQVVEYDTVSVFVPDQEGGVRIPAWRGFSDIESVRQFVRELKWQTLEDRWDDERVAVISDTHSDERWIVSPGVAHIRSWVGAALVIKRRLIGELNVDSTRVGAFDERTARTVAAFASQAAVAIENARLHEEVRTYAEELEWRVEERTAELRTEQEKVEAILSSVGEAIAMTDLDMRIQYVNQAFTTLTGYPAEEALGKRASELLGGRMAEKGRRAVRRARAEGQPCQVELTIQRRDGRTYEAAMSTEPMRDAEGNLVSYVSSHRDISRLKELDRARRRFMTNVSHELRTPVANLKLYAQLARSGQRPEKMDRYLHVLEEQSDRLHQLVDDILLMTELDSGQAITTWEAISLPTLIGDVVTRYRDKAQEARLTLVSEPSPSDLPALQGDSFRLAQALNELAENALTFTPAGGQVTVEVETTEAEGRCWVTISVRDTGPGISAEEREKVFQRFFRGQLAESGTVPGTGLGLSVVQEIVRAHGGRVTLESQEGQGSTFTLWLRCET